MVVLVLVIIVFAGLFAYTFVASSSTISGLNQTISSRNGLVAAQASTISYDTSQLSSLQSQISTLQSQVTSDQAQVASLTSRLAIANSTVNSDSSEIATLNSQISTLNSQVSADQAQISTLQAQEATFVGSIQSALGEPNSYVFESNYGYSVPSTYMESFSYTSGGAGVWVVSVSGSTSSNTVVGTNLTSNTFNIKSSGVVAFEVPASTTFTVNIYDSNYAAYSATVSIWEFY